MSANSRIWSSEGGTGAVSGLVIYAVHLKSSRIGLCFNGKDLVSDLGRSAKSLERIPSGQALAANIRAALQNFNAQTYSSEIETSPAVTDDALNSARQREATIAAVAVEVGKDVGAGRTVVVAGDFNTPLNEPCKTGERLTEDSRPTIRCSDTISAPICQADGYDDTLALLTKGHVSGLRMRALTTPGTGRTFAKPVFIEFKTVSLEEAAPPLSVKTNQRRRSGGRNDPIPGGLWVMGDGYNWGVAVHKRAAAIAHY